MIDWRDTLNWMLYR